MTENAFEIISVPDDPDWREVVKAQARTIDRLRILKPVATVALLCAGFLAGFAAAWAYAVEVLR